MNLDILSFLKRNWKIESITSVILIASLIAIIILAILFSLTCISGTFGVPQPRGFGNAGESNPESTSPASSNSSDAGFNEDCFYSLLSKANPKITKDKAAEYKKYVEEAGSSMGVDPAAVAALSEQESHWINYECSFDHLSRGLMQIQTRYQHGCSWGDYEVWKDEAIPLAKKYGGQGISNIMSERDSLMGGAAILRRNLDYYKNYYLSFGDYNGGGGCVKSGQIVCVKAKNYANEVTDRYKKYKKCLQSGGGTAGTNTNIGNRIKKIIDYAKSHQWGQDGDGTGCFRACDGLYKSVLGNPTTDADLNTVAHEGIPSDSDLNTLRDHLNKDHIVYWYVRGEYSGQHWIIITSIDDKNNITYLDPVGNGSMVTRPYNYKPSGKNWYYFSRTPKSPNSYLRGIYRY